MLPLLTAHPRNVTETFIGALKNKTDLAEPPAKKANCPTTAQVGIM